MHARGRPDLLEPRTDRLGLPFVLMVAFGLIAACAPRPSPPLVRQPLATQAEEAPSAAEILAASRAIVLTEASEVLGPSVLAEIMRVPSAVLSRRLGSLPRMIQQPDGTWRSEPPVIAAGVRTAGGWIQLGASGSRLPFDAGTSAELDRLLGMAGFWRERPITKPTCTDASGIIVLSRDQGRELVSPFPCGLTGLVGRAAETVRDGRTSGR